MPINFVTGLPRAGKTLWTITYVKELAEKQGRQVYYCNIPGVTIPGWIEIDHPDKWLDLPDGAIVLVDELQDFWPKALSGSRPPPPILELSKHGKRGFDMFFITQEPNLVHSTPRDLCAHHYYVVRAWGTHKAMVHKFDRMELHPEKRKSKSEKFPFIYPKKAFDWYKSADVHNIQRSIPLKLLFIPLGVVFAGLMIWLGVSLFQGSVSKAAKSSTAAASSDPFAALTGGTARPPSASAPGSAASSARAPLTAAEYLAARSPRLPDFPHTAPVYDSVTQPTEAPYPAACVSMSGRCKCYTQQGTVMHVAAETCALIVRHGFFVDWRKPESPKTAGRDPGPLAEKKRAVGTLPPAEFPEQQPGLTPADVPHVLALRKPSMQAYASANQ
jgi:zona occludens toxin